MKLKNFKKNSIVFLIVSFSLIIVTFLWDQIFVPLNNPKGIIGPLSIQDYNPLNDTIRYILFITLPALLFFTSKIIINKKKFSIKEILFEKLDKSENSHSNKYFIIPSLFFFFVIIFEFLSLNLFNYRLDTFHDGDFLTPAYNYLFMNKLWLSSYTVHGGSDFFYPIIMWKILGLNTIGAARFSFYFLILLLKFLSIIFSYQLTKNLYLKRCTKLFFFIILSSILISMSSFTVPLNYSYFSYRDIYILLFLIFFMQLFINDSFKLSILISITLISTISALMHIDTGFYINFILLSYIFYLFILKKYKEIFVIFLSLFIFWLLIIYFISFEEFKAFLDHSISMIFSLDLMHGLKYPTPFFSINESEYGTRATRGLLLQLTAGLFVINYLFLGKKKISSSKKIFFVFLYLVSFIMYKNGLGRSDSNHLRMSADFPILINIFFILNYFFIFFEKKILNKSLFSFKFFAFLSAIYLSSFYLLNISKYNFNNMINYKKNFLTYINYKDENFIDSKTIKFVNYYKKLNEESSCIQIFTFDLAIPYLLKKPSCTKYFSSWLASSTVKQNDYVKNLITVDPKYILYNSTGTNFDLTYKPEPPEVYERLYIVNSYILSNYKQFNFIDDYVILEKK